jgi:MoxR-like ATPase
MAPDVLRHRLVLTFQAEAEEITPEQVLERLLAAVPVP